MNKKLMVVAVAGALTAPAMALAQTTIYGLINAEYGFVSQPNNAAGLSRDSADTLNSGASRLGFRGEEKLGGGMAAFYQCESDLRFLGGSSQTSGTWCDRNSALGLKGGFGSVFIGNWDTPIKRVGGAVRITNETGWVGSQQMLLSNGGGWTGTFSVRNPYSVNYDSPGWGGFSFSVQYTTLQAPRSAAGNAQTLANTVPTAKGRQTSASAQYAGGPVLIVGGYAKNTDDRTVSGLLDQEDTAYLVGGTFTMGPVKVGLTYIDAEITTSAAGATTSRKSWNLAGDWNIGGPHVLRFGYANAGDAETSAGGGSDTGAQLMQFGYLYNMSKRTQLSISYGQMNNDNLGIYSLTGNTVNAAAGGIQLGESSSVVVLGMVHTF